MTATTTETVRGRLAGFSRSLEQALHRALALAGREAVTNTLYAGAFLLTLSDDRTRPAVMRPCKLSTCEALRRISWNTLDNELAISSRTTSAACEAHRRVSSASPARGDPRAVLGREEVRAPTCSSRSSPSARATPRTPLQEQRHDALLMRSTTSRTGSLKRPGATEGASTPRGGGRESGERPSGRRRRPRATKKKGDALDCLLRWV